MNKYTIKIEVADQIAPSFKTNGRLSVNEVDFDLISGKAEFTVEQGAYNIWAFGNDYECEIGTLNVVENRTYQLRPYELKNVKLLMVALIISLAMILAYFVVENQPELFLLTGVLGFFGTSFMYYLEKLKESKNLKLVRIQ